MMADSLGKMGSVTQNYLDLVQKAMSSMPNADATQFDAFKAYVERQVAANQAFVDKLLRARDLKEAVQIQMEYFQAQMRVAVSNAMRIGDSVTTSKT
jgi:hypothetical protein